MPPPHRIASQKKKGEMRREVGIQLAMLFKVECFKLKLKLKRRVYEARRPGKDGWTDQPALAVEGLALRRKSWGCAQ